MSLSLTRIFFVSLSFFLFLSSFLLSHSPSFVPLFSLPSKKTKTHPHHHHQGAIVASSFDPQARQASSEKSGSRDLVTSTDAAAEAAIMRRLRAAFPGHQFVGEEEASEAKSKGLPVPRVGRVAGNNRDENGEEETNDAPTWCVDPLDGTTNFVHGWPFVCVSIGLVVGGYPVLGVVFNPIMRELFVGVLGRGATVSKVDVAVGDGGGLCGERRGEEKEGEKEGEEKGSKPIRVSGETDLSRSLVGTEIGVSEDPLVVDAIFGRVKALASRARSLRCGGSCALGLCGVASGRLDAFYEIGFGGVWDCAAGAAVLLEAGGVLLDPSGSEFDVDARRVLAASSEAVARDAARVLGEVELGPGEPRPTTTTR